MHPSVMHFIADQVAFRHLDKARVLEVGSLNVNGSVRELFSGEYFGTDMSAGPGVDFVVNAHKLSRFVSDNFGETRFEVIVCTEMLEHDDEPWTSLHEMWMCAERGAILLVTARGFDQRGSFQFHGYPNDYWRYSVTGFTRLLEATGWEPDTVAPDPTDPGVFAVARRA